jgi:predicted DCC family thiol-disulfide oxidoreductase YuxK
MTGRAVPRLVMRASGAALPPSLAALQPLFVFDGVCVLCSHAVRFILKRERDKQLRFAPAQSSLGIAIYQALGLPSDVYETLILLDHGQAYVKSAAVIELVRRLRQPWRSLAILDFLPRGLLDWLYDRVARNRYSWFGRYDSCAIADPDLKDRFLEG